MKRNAQSSIDESDKVKRVLIPSAVFRPLSKNWCVSTSNISRFNFEWNIQHFALLTENKTYSSTKFQDINGPPNLKWCLLELSIRDEVVHVMLFKDDSYNWLMRPIYRFKMAIVNQNRENPKINVQLENFGFKISKSQACSYLMSDGSFTICCEIEDRIEGEIQSNGDMVSSDKQVH